MDLGKLIQEKRKGLTAWVSFSDSFDIELAYTERRELERMVERSKKTVWKRHQQVEDYDDERFNAQLAEKIVDWEGLTLGKLAGLTNIEIAESDADQTVPCTDANKVALLNEIYGLNTFIRDTIMDISAFREARAEEERKNLPPSQGSFSN